MAGARKLPALCNFFKRGQVALNKNFSTSKPNPNPNSQL